MKQIDYTKNWRFYKKRTARKSIVGGRDKKKTAQIEIR